MSTADGTVVTREGVVANRIVTLGLATGTYTVCVAQPAAAGWDAARSCATATWQAPVSSTVTLGRAHQSGRRLMVPVVLGPSSSVSFSAG